ncbi:MAG: hypothetical protein O2820_13795 [Planctomycetota bacterium]|nr:hypothetical protein [Planctomycetota bacterium]MDA1250285.1 hypothetical protein [Planctomycetota bacterium]
MPVNYHVTGWISVFFFLLSLAGIFMQLREIWRRKLDFRTCRKSNGELDRPTAVLSLNQFFASFLAFYSFLVYGLCSEPFNHYLVWTRLPATLLAVAILYEIWHDRRGRLPALALVGSLVLFVLAVAVLVSGEQVIRQGRDVSAILAIFAAAVFGQGIIHQIVLIRRSGQTGAISLRMHQLTTCKDFSTIAFALAMPLESGWPLMTVGGVGVVTKSVLMWHFRWVRLKAVTPERGSELANRTQAPDRRRNGSGK